MTPKQTLRYFAYDAAAPGEPPPDAGTWFVATRGRTEGGPELWFGPYRTKAEAEQSAREANAR